MRRALLVVVCVSGLVRSAAAFLVGTLLARWMQGRPVVFENRALACALLLLLVASYPVLHFAERRALRLCREASS